MLSILALGASEVLINRIIDLDTISRLKLNELQNQCLRVVLDSPALSIDVLFDQDKVRFEPTALGQANQPSIFEQRPFDPKHTMLVANTTLRLENLSELLKLLFQADDQITNIQLQGDYHLLFALQKIISQMELDLAADLSPWIGASLAHEIGKLQYLPKQLLKTAKSTEFMLIDSLKEDSGLFAARWQMDDLQKNTSKINQELDRVEAKIKRLQQLDQLNSPENLF